MLLGNYNVIHKSPGRFRAGVGAICNNNFLKNGSLRAIHTAQSSPKLWGLPTGYGQNGWMLPRVAGYVVGFSEIQLGQTGTAVMGINGDGGLDIIVSGTANLSLISSGTGTCTISLTMGGDMAAALYGSGSISGTVTGTGTLGAIAFSTGESTITLTADADITALGYMTGEMSPFTPLSPEGLAKAVWDSLATEYNTSGTMGAKLNTASSGGVDMNSLAQAVWEYGVRSLTTSAGLTPEQEAQLLSASQATKWSDIITDNSSITGSFGQKFEQYGGVSHVIDRSSFDDESKSRIEKIEEELKRSKDTLISAIKSIKIDTPKIISEGKTTVVKYNDAQQNFIQEFITETIPELADKIDNLIPLLKTYEELILDFEQKEKDYETLIGEIIKSK